MYQLDTMLEDTVHVHEYLVSPPPGQRHMPPLVTKRYYHFMSTIAVSHKCAWLMVIGWDYGQAGFVLLELSEWHNETETSTQCMLIRCCWLQLLLYSMLCCFPSFRTHKHKKHVHVHVYVRICNNLDNS